MQEAARGPALWRRVVTSTAIGLTWLFISTAPASAKDGSVSGVVMRGTAVAGARVTVGGSCVQAGSADTVTTGADGSYKVEWNCVPGDEGKPCTIFILVILPGATRPFPVLRHLNRCDDDITDVLAEPLNGENMCAANDSEGDVTLDTPGGRLGGIPELLKNVKVTRKKLISTPKRGGTEAKGTLDCTFENPSTTKKVKFVICQMIASKTEPLVTIDPFEVCQLKLTGTTISCEKKTLTPPRVTRRGFHFGCAEVEIPPSGSKTVMTVIEDAFFRGKNASDFQVNYADVVSLIQGDGTELTFDPTNCDQCEGVGGQYDISGLSGIGPGAAGIWAMWHQPWVDPYQWLQPLNGVPGEKEYVPYEEYWSVPEAFSIDVSGLPRTPPGGFFVPNSYRIDINLFDWFTMHASTVDADVFYQLDYDASSGFRTSPPRARPVPGVIPPFDELYESFDVLVPPPSVPEGTRTLVRITTFDSQNYEPIIFQTGKFVHDTEPPVALQLRDQALGGQLHLEITVEDATTYPALANVWFSTDDHQTWSTASMKRHPTQDTPLATFKADIDLGGSSSVDYFITVQDEVLNLLWYGPVQKQLPRLVPTASNWGVNGDQVVPPVGTDGSGECMATLNSARTEYRIGCSSDVADGTAAHIHAGSVGTTGPIVYFFDAGTTFSAVVNQSSLESQHQEHMGDIFPLGFDEFTSLLDTGSLYVDVHTPSHPGGEVRGQVPSPNSVFFPQFGNGGGLTSDIVLLNSATTGDPITGEVVLLDPDGNPLDVAFESSGPAGGTQISVEPRGAVTLRTDGQGELAVGSVAVFSDRPLAGVVRFAIPGFGVAGVPASPPLTTAIVPVRNEGSIRTGLAIRNTAGTAIRVHWWVWKWGALFPEHFHGEFNIVFGGRRAVFIDELVPELRGVDFTGVATMQVDEGSFAAIAVEQGEGVFTSLPVIPVQGRVPPDDQ